MMSRSRYLQYILYVDTLDMQIDNLQTELERVVEYSKLRRLAAGDPFNDSVLKFICKNVKWCQRYYTLLYEMSLNVNEAFGWSQLANLFHSFVHLLADLYWIYWRFYNQFAFFFVGKQKICYNFIFETIAFRICHTDRSDFLDCGSGITKSQ